MIRVDIKSELLTWARERAGLEAADLCIGFPSLRPGRKGPSGQRSNSLLEGPDDHLIELGTRRLRQLFPIE